MKITIFQKVYDAIKKWQAPKWFTTLMGECQSIFLATLYQIGKDQMEAIKDKVIEVAGSTMSSEDKFKEVFNYCKSININIKGSVLNALINAIVLALKNKGTI
jgi:hypothetical protein